MIKTKLNVYQMLCLTFTVTLQAQREHHCICFMLTVVTLLVPEVIYFTAHYNIIITRLILIM